MDKTRFSKALRDANLVSEHPGGLCAEAVDHIFYKVLPPASDRCDGEGGRGTGLASDKGDGERGRGAGLASDRCEGGQGMDRIFYKVLPPASDRCDGWGLGWHQTGMKIGLGGIGLASDRTGARVWLGRHQRGTDAEGWVLVRGAHLPAIYRPQYQPTIPESLCQSI